MPLVTIAVISWEAACIMSQPEWVQVKDGHSITETGESSVRTPGFDAQPEASAALRPLLISSWLCVLWVCVSECACVFWSRLASKRVPQFDSMSKVVLYPSAFHHSMCCDSWLKAQCSVLLESLKKRVHSNMKMLSWFTHPHVIPNLYAFLDYVKHKKMFWKLFLPLEWKGKKMKSILVFFFECVIELLLEFLLIFWIKLLLYFLIECWF